jgi:hypothetical protein
VSEPAVARLPTIYLVPPVAPVADPAAQRVDRIAALTVRHDALMREAEVAHAVCQWWHARQRWIGSELVKVRQEIGEMLP